MLAMSLDQHQQLRKRTKDFALRVIRMTQALPKTKEADVLGRQVLRSSTSVAANYRATGQARSKPEFISKLAVVLEEADETVFWLEMLADSGVIKPARLAALQQEANQLVAVFGASLRTAKNNR